LASSRKLIIFIFLLSTSLLSTGCRNSASDESLSPTNSPSTEVPYVVGLTNFQIRMEFRAKVQASNYVKIVVPQNLVFIPVVKSGVLVREGQLLGKMQIEKAVSEKLEVEAKTSTIAKSQLSTTKAMEVDVFAQLDGTLTISEGVLTIAKKGLDIVASISGIQALRARSGYSQSYSLVETIVGTQNAPCLAFWVDSPDSDSASTDTGSVGTFTAHCRISSIIETSPELSAQLSIEGDVTRGAVTVPHTYIKLDENSKSYFVEMEDGSSRPIEVGASDGVRRIVIAGLSPGDELAIRRGD